MVSTRIFGSVTHRASISAGRKHMHPSTESHATLLAQWTALRVGFRMDSVNLQVKRGELVAVVGMVGSGKSMLMHSVLRETNKIAGKYVDAVHYGVVVVDSAGFCLAVSIVF